MVIKIKVNKGTLERIRKEREERLRRNEPDMLDYMFGEDEKWEEQELKNSIIRLVKDGHKVSMNNVNISRIRKMGTKNSYEYYVFHETFLRGEVSVVTDDLLIKDVNKAVDRYLELVEKYSDKKNEK
jgi:hypothetical protein